jgi:toxin ParE1/3/4
MTIVWSLTSKERLVEILDYIAKDKTDAALRLIDTIETKVGDLVHNPFIGRMFSEMDSPSVRELVIHENYGVIYEIGTQTINILTIRHFRKQTIEPHR